MAAGLKTGTPEHLKHLFQLIVRLHDVVKAFLDASRYEKVSKGKYLVMAGSSYTKDDDFDWEAAIAEIDIACNEAAMSVAPAVSNPGSFSIDIHNEAKNGVLSGFLETSQTKNSQSGKVPIKVTKALRQATLDAFLDIQEKFKDQDVGNQHPRSYKDSICEESNADVLKNNVETMSLKNSTCEAINADARCYSIDPVAAASWTYPVNVPLRDYQFSIVKTALFSNTLVALPTGLGKTLVAAVVMYNYFRWFPSGKIVFTAPSRPLVMQQIEACHNIVGIPQKWTIDMTGQISPCQRLVYWQSKRVFFVTPQVLEKDIQSGSCILKELVCLVVDEAHRAVGNYSYCIVVREIVAASIELRILALTATPGSKQESIQKVIDNLHISTLEHRSENDPDVLPYTHNRNIELIPVAMNKETLNLGSLLLEVVQPVIQKLCSLGVFYNKDLPKLTPFEILSARDRFRQSPPAFLSELQYGEVEGYFGLALTLYHIYKLLFSHGIRPSLQMLHQKLQQGFMGKNEKLWQAKLLMQQNVRHGAPDPKLSKMKEIITEHFNAKDPASTRVIIFTNFRESVKDILESLQNANDAVKAVEFIGQSSGKASKGQSQKVQQEVLQKFRSGGYNTIVATSIGEEGLDIMEVDLVICFDANVSPLRMIQRFGRTGRKRDGRVVILASEGSELQGYMKKKAKENALRKHMRNGGINSFTFHVSPRMVPHCYRPKVQFVEMSVDKFIPRGRKSKCGSRQAGSGYDELTESEKCLLEKYFAFCSETLWKPSLIAFPRYQLFPSCIFNIKHSSRTTEMLIHTLESLHEHETRYEIPKPEVKSIVGNCSTSRDYVPQGIQEDESECETVSSASELDMCDQCTPIEEDKNVLLPSEVTSPSGLIEELQPDATNLAGHDKEQIKNNSSFVNTSLHRCLFNTGFVSVNQAGHVTISSPPSLPLAKELVSNYEVVSIANISEKNFSVPGAQGTVISRFPGTSESASFLHKVDSLCITERRLSPNALSLPLPSSKHSSNHISEETTQDTMIGDLHRSPENVIDSFAEFGLSSSIKDQKMASDGKDGQVQVKRYNVKPVVAQGKEMPESVSSTWKNKMQSLKENNLPCLSHSSANHVGRDEIPDSLLDTSTICNVKSMLRNNASGVLNDATNHYTLNNGTNEICKDETVPLIKSIGDAQIFNTPKDVFSLPPELPSTQLAKPVDNQLQNFESPSPSKTFALQTKGTQSGVKNGFSQDWHLSIEDDEQSLRRPRKFKRLRKCKDDGEKSIEEKCSRGNMHATAFRNQNKFKSLKGRQRKKISALPFIDEEAEVSSDEKASTDEDDDGESSINSESDSFIDDRLEPTAPESSNIDMFAVYRRSLFTQSPSTSGLNQLAHCQTSISDEDDSSHTSENDETYFLSGIKPVATPYTSSHAQVVDSKASTSTASYNSDQSGRKVATSLLESKATENKQVLRKRELFLQTDDTTEISKCLKSSMSPTVMNELQIENNSSEKKNNQMMIEKEFLSACIDDDLFIGIDPDALEAEAIEMARLRSTMNQERLNKPFPGESCLVDANAKNSTLTNLENSLLDGNPNRSVLEEKVCSNVCLASDYKEKRKDISHDLADMDLLCTPSFDLGISDDLN